uniref:Haptoglobin (Fragments) n=1 Tax=Bos taurus TaxID=9913 RepID=Q7M365_BOVIN|nr:haptoglobin precursor - bovine (fragments) [Bos taurus]
VETGSEATADSCPKAPEIANSHVEYIIGGSLDAKGSFPWQAKMVS